jgi:acetoin utilization deacetylase AcuC-like enzyme
MTTLLFTHTACMRHDAGPGHPENARRLQAVLNMIAKQDPMDLVKLDAPRATDEQIERVHPRAYREAVLDAIPASGYRALDADTVVSPGSGEAALRAAGAVCAAVDAVATDEAANGFCAVRPPGHHAEPARAMGFCLFNSVAIGAAHARAAHGLERVSIFDFDVHHGNGTEAAFKGDAAMQYLSTHQWPLYPGTGAREERGVGNIVNVPLPAGTDSAAWRAAVTEEILPGIDAHAPDLILVSAGFDAHRADPLAQLRLVEDDYAWVTAELLALARRHCGGRLVSSLEGGYDPAATALSAWAHLDVLLHG